MSMPTSSAEARAGSHPGRRQVRGWARRGVAAVVVLASALAGQTAAGAHPGQRSQGQAGVRVEAPHGSHSVNPGMAGMHELMVQDNPGMARMHEQMVQDNPGMARMHEQMMKSG